MRSTLDKLVSWTGLILAAVLLVAGGLLTWANAFVSDQVHDQLAMQDITMPDKASLETKAQHDHLDQYAGQKMTTGAQAKAFADYYILVHMNAAGDGATYEEVSGQYMGLLNDPNADPDQVAEVGQLRQTLFMGNTLRGELLTAYAFDTLGTIAAYAAIGAFVAAGLLLVLAGIGFVHAKRARESAAVSAGKVGTPITA